MRRVEPLIIYGSGGFAREVLELLRDGERSETRWDILGFADDDTSKWDTTVNDLPVVGGLEWVRSRRPRVHAVIAVGSPPVKRRIADRLSGAVAGFPSLVHPTVVASRYIEFGAGTIVTAGNVLTANIRLGDFVMINLMCTVGHDCDFGSYVTLSPGVNVSGGVHLREGCDIGTGAALVPGVTVGEWSIIGAGAVVARSLPPNCTAVGVPAAVIKQREAGWHNAS